MLVADVNWNDPQYIRAGIIPIIKYDHCTFYAFGLDNHIGYLCDFGGHREPTDIDALDSAIREYQEEALNIFGCINREMLQDCEVLIGHHTVEILLPVSGPLYFYTMAFAVQKVNTDHEIQNIIWLSRKQLLTAIDEPETHIREIKIYHMYDKILKVLQMNRSLL